RALTGEVPGSGGHVRCTEGARTRLSRRGQGPLLVPTRTVVMADPARGTAPVTDHRAAPRGVLPRRMQTWLMAGVALGVLAIIVFSGHPEPAARPVQPSAAVPAAPNPERLRDYQDRLRALDDRARQ